jgi:diphosphomevalonate decarboxylase
VAWQMGEQADGSDSVAVQIAPASHWPTMRALILVVSAEKKGVSSTSGMQITVSTSSLFPHRASTVVPKHMALMQKAILERDFETFAKVTMMESNSFHATCADTFPPIFYMNDVSKAAIRVVEGINEKAGKLVAAYTFDAGPNAVIYYEEANASAVAGAVKGFLGELDGWKNVDAQGAEGLDERAVQVLKEGVSRVILTSVGDDPIRTEESLIGEDGEPLKK